MPDEKYRDNRDCRQARGHRVNCADGVPQGGELWQRLGWIVVELETEEVAQLRDDDDRRNAGGKADRYWIGNVLDVGAEP